ncbi:MAG TPA: prepilin-type N-terminal cleavage/methylation domain-containing protein [Aquabacterium sp.]|nr:prepilin-type N-terminal cleavage/methylation domain-containing protein [Aquabacterium sp.]
MRLLACPLSPCSPRLRRRGFTLIEVLVALMILSALALAAFRGLDAIGTARQVADANLKQTLRLQAVMMQFEADLAQVMDTMVVNGFAYDGANLRLTRRTGAGVQVVVWSLREGRLQRWASPDTTRYGELRTYWQQAQSLLGREPGTLVALRGLTQWQVYCFRSGTMSNCQSTGNVAQVPGALPAGALPPAGAAAGAALVAAAATREQLPTALRLQLVFGPGSGFQGRLLRDIMLAPQPNQR